MSNFAISFEDKVVLYPTLNTIEIREQMDVNDLWIMLGTNAGDLKISKGSPFIFNKITNSRYELSNNWTILGLDNFPISDVSQIVDFDGRIIRHPLTFIVENDFLKGLDGRLKFSVRMGPTIKVDIFNDNIVPHPKLHHATCRAFIHNTMYTITDTYENVFYDNINVFVNKPLVSAKIDLNVSPEELFTAVQIFPITALEYDPVNGIVI